MSRPNRPAVSLSRALIAKRDVVVFADALEDEEGRRTVTAVGDEVRAGGADGVGLAGAEPHLLRRVAQEDADVPLDDVERVVDVRVVVPRHLLRRRNL